jgi:hypothetical protein
LRLGSYTASEQDPTKLGELGLRSVPSDSTAPGTRGAFRALSTFKEALIIELGSNSPWFVGLTFTTESAVQLDPKPGDVPFPPVAGRIDDDDVIEIAAKLLASPRP